MYYCELIKNYEIQYLKNAISFIVNMPADELIYDPIQKVFIFDYLPINFRQFASTRNKNFVGYGFR